MGGKGRDARRWVKNTRKRVAMDRILVDTRVVQALNLECVVFQDTELRADIYISS